MKNPVNVKKNTLEVKQINSFKCALSFSFDATAPCRVSVFINARDEHGRIKSSEQTLAVVSYDVGLNQQFPAPGAEPVLIDLDSIAAGDWGNKATLLKNQPFPVVIRIEALDPSTAGGSSSSSSSQSLNVVEVGGFLPTWVCAQTTFAQMQRTKPDGAVPVTQGIWQAHHVLQKIWIRGQNYELQEIYGMEAGRPAGDVVDGVEAAAEEMEGNDCVICLSAPRNTTVLPCRHHCMCRECADNLKKQTNKCPVCRNVITSLLNITVTK